jgi:tRNA modification GTPase
MLPNLEETIVALASAPGPGARAIVRLSGPTAGTIAGQVLQDATVLRPDGRQCIAGHIALPGVSASLPGDVYFWPAPRTYTGQDMAEIHTLGCPPLVDLLVGQCLKLGARAAAAGEFSLRAFLAGKLDLTRAEAVVAVIEASGRDELKQALAQLAGGVSRPLQQLREDLLNLLADVEASLDFSDEDIRFVKTHDMLHRVTRGLALVTLVGKQLDQRALGQRAFRAVLAGRPNAGKSSLFNALAGVSKALVSAEPGTTRDYLVQRLQVDGIPIEIVDTAGLRKRADGVEAKAQELGRSEAETADLVLWCREAGQSDDTTHSFAQASVLTVGTKCDLAAVEASLLATSAVTGQGLAELRKMLAERARAHSKPALAPSLSRCRHHVDACLDNLRRAHAEVLDEAPLELVALELRNTLEELGAMVGAVYTDDLLDRVFSRFCIGK